MGVDDGRGIVRETERGWLRAAVASASSRWHKCASKRAESVASAVRRAKFSTSSLSTRAERKARADDSSASVSAYSVMIESVAEVESAEGASGCGYITRKPGDTGENAPFIIIGNVGMTFGPLETFGVCIFS